MRHFLRATLIAGAGALGLASSLIHPFGNVRAGQLSNLLAGADADPADVQLFEKSCPHCHSENTEWTLYSYVAPMSWLVERDVSDARAVT